MIYFSATVIQLMNPSVIEMMVFSELSAPHMYMILTELKGPSRQSGGSSTLCSLVKLSAALVTSMEKEFHRALVFLIQAHYISGFVQTDNNAARLLLLFFRILIPMLDCFQCSLFELFGVLRANKTILWVTMKGSE